VERLEAALGRVDADVELDPSPRNRRKQATLLRDLEAAEKKLAGLEAVVAESNQAEALRSAFEDAAARVRGLVRTKNPAKRRQVLESLRLRVRLVPVPSLFTPKGVPVGYFPEVDGELTTDRFVTVVPSTG
jgi:hypothetical protein